MQYNELHIYWPKGLATSLQPTNRRKPPLEVTLQRHILAHQVFYQIPKRVNDANTVVKKGGKLLEGHVQEYRVKWGIFFSYAFIPNERTICKINQSICFKSKHLEQNTCCIVQTYLNQFFCCKNGLFNRIQIPCACWSTQVDGTNFSFTRASNRLGTT